MRSCQDLNHFKPPIHAPNLLQSAYFTCIQMYPGIPKNYENIWKSWRDLQMSSWISQSHASWRKKNWWCVTPLSKQHGVTFVSYRNPIHGDWELSLMGSMIAPRKAMTSTDPKLPSKSMIHLYQFILDRFVCFVPGTLGRHKSLHSCCGLSSLASKTETENVQ